MACWMCGYFRGFLLVIFILSFGALFVFVPPFTPFTDNLVLTIALGDMLGIERFFWAINQAFPGKLAQVWGVWSSFVRGPVFYTFAAIGSFFVAAALMVNNIPSYLGIALAPAVFNCIKIAAIFVLLILVRVTVPKYKLETITKLGWLHVFVWLVLIFLISVIILSFFV